MTDKTEIKETETKETQTLSERLEEVKNLSEQIQNLKLNPGFELLLDLYSHYQQANYGDVASDKPNLLDFEGRNKWFAWDSLKGLPQDEAIDKYIQIAHLILCKTTKK